MNWNRTEDFPWIPSPSKHKYRGGTSIIPLLLPSKSFPFHYSSIVLPLTPCIVAIDIFVNNARKFFNVVKWLSVQIMSAEFNSISVLLHPAALYRGCNGIEFCVQLQIVMDRTIIIPQHTYRFEYPITCIINRDNLMLLWCCNLICSLRPTEQPSIFHSHYELLYRSDSHGSGEGIIMWTVIHCNDNIPYYFLKSWWITSVGHARVCSNQLLALLIISWCSWK